MKIAVPTRGNMVDDHFGHCDKYTVFTVEQNEVQHVEELPSLQGCGCKSNIVSVLKQMGVNVMLAGNMGDGALNILNNHDIQVYRGCSGDVHKLVDLYLKSQITDSGEGCKAHEHHQGERDHQCSR